MKKVKRSRWWCLDCHCPMEYQEKDDFYKCPECGVEVWFPAEIQKKDEVTKLMGEMFAEHEGRQLDPLPAGRADPKKHGGGSGSGKGRKQAAGGFTPWYQGKMY